MTRTCQECGVDPRTLHYRCATSRYLRRGRCHACAQRAGRAKKAARWATPKYLLENAS